MANWLSRFIGADASLGQSRPNTNRAAQQAGRAGVMIAEPNPFRSAAPGQEMAQFLREITVVVGQPVAEVDLNRNLKTDFGLDELDISECLIVAEEAWNALTPRKPMDQSDLDAQTNRFQTLNDIIAFVQAGQL